MANAPSITVDATRLNQLLPQYANLAQATAADALNKKAFRIGLGAMKSTPVADRAKIEKLGLQTVSVTQRLSARTGKFRQVRKLRFDADSAVANFKAAVLAKPGGAQKLRTFANNAEIKKAARRWIGRKLSSITFLASGWLPALRRLSGRAGMSFPAGLARQYGSDKGYGIPAQSDASNPSVTIANSVTHDRDGVPIPQKQKAAMEAALRQSIAAETASTEDYIRRKIQEGTKH